MSLNQRLNYTFRKYQEKDRRMEAKVSGILMITCHIREKSHSLFHVSLYFHYVYYQWLRRCATNRKVAGSIPDGVIRIFH